MIEIIQKVTHVSFNAVYDTVTVNGSYRIKEDNLLEGIDGGLSVEGVFIGNFNTYTDGEDLLVNKSGVKLQNIALVDETVTQCIEDIKELIAS